MIKGQSYDPVKADLWSAGVVLFVMLFGRLPFDHHNKHELCRKITSGDYTIPETASDGAKDLLRQLLTVDPALRIDFFRIKQHPWFTLWMKADLLQEEVESSDGWAKPPISQDGI